MHFSLDLRWPMYEGSRVPSLPTSLPPTFSAAVPSAPLPSLPALRLPQKSGEPPISPMPIYTKPGTGWPLLTKSGVPGSTGMLPGKGLYPPPVPTLTTQKMVPGANLACQQGALLELAKLQGLKSASPASLPPPLWGLHLPSPPLYPSLGALLGFSPYSPGKKMFPCPQCRYLTDRKNNLKRHIATMHGESDRVLECCGVGFRSKAALREHVMVFHSAGYMCRYCGRNFCRKALLRRHLAVHSGHKEHTCPDCDYATSHKSNLDRHRRVHERGPEALDTDCSDNEKNENIIEDDFHFQPDIGNTSSSTIHRVSSKMDLADDISGHLVDSNTQRLSYQDNTPLSVARDIDSMSSESILLPHQGSDSELYPIRPQSPLLALNSPSVQDETEEEIPELDVDSDIEDGGNIDVVNFT